MCSTKPLTESHANVAQATHLPYDMQMCCLLFLFCYTNEWFIFQLPLTFSSCNLNCATSVMPVR